MLDTLLLETADQIGALAHPARQRILRLLTSESMTNKQLSQVLGESPPRLHFHVRELLKAGLIELVAERPKGGVLEKYYRATARNFRLSVPLGSAEPAEGEILAATLEAARRECLRAREHFGVPLPATRVLHEQAQLSPERLARINSYLDAIEAELREAAEVPKVGAQATLITYLMHPLAPTES